ncbi:hypothetical protein [Clostridium sp.]|uniref:hypothetical protein n=1 Tax=Clostridium sp. TaxID=1506 RepID=UPI003F4BF66D
MGDNRTLSGIFVILSIVTFIACLLLNFVEFQDGSSASIRSVIITFWYATVWILVLVTGIKGRNRGAVKYCSVFCVITFITSITVLYGSVVDTVGGAGWLFPLMLLFLGQWHGLRFFMHSNITYFTLIAVISLTILVIAVIWLKRNKTNQNII